MKNLAFISFFLFSICAFAQFTDDFSNPNFSERWSGDVEHFIVNPGEQLQLNATVAGNSTLVTPAVFVGNMEWEFWLRLNFAPSNQNLARIYLMSDNSNLSGALNGYYIQIGETGAADPIELFRQTGTARTSLARGTSVFGAIANFPVRIRVTRSDAGEWNIYADPSGGTNFQLEASTTDNVFNTSAFFGFHCIYTVANRANFWFDDVKIAGEVFVDNTPPTVLSVTPNANLLTVVFSEPIADISPSDFSVSAGVGAPGAAALSADGTTVLLAFSNNFAGGNDYVLTINNVADLAGNVLQQTEYSFRIPEQVLLVQDDFSDGDFTGNPTWSGDVTSFAVVEEDGNYMLRSTSQTANARFYLSTPSSVATDCEWSFWVNLQFNTSGTNFVDYYLMSDNADLSASGINGYFVRIGGTADKISLYKKINGVETEIIVGESGVTNFANNTLVIKVIRDADNVWTLQYDRTGASNNFAMGGRVTNADILSSSYLGIYIAQSTSSFFGRHFFDNIYAGPIIPDTTPPTVSAVSIVQGASNQIAIVFSEPILQVLPENFSVSDVNPSSAVLSADQQSVTLTFANNFSSGVIHTLFMNNIFDLAGNQLAASASGYQFGIMEGPKIGDLIFNELMFDSATDSEDYIEIYNKSDKIIDLTGLRFMRRTATTAPTVNIPAGTVIFPHSYLAFSAQPERLHEQFNTPEEANIVSLSLGTFLPNSGATIFLTNGTVIFDELTYSDRWHDTEGDTRGVSLERINPEVLARDPQNWQSATEAVRFGTPGYKNSRYQSVENIMPRVFSIDIIAENQMQVTFSKAIQSADFQIEGVSITPVQADNFTFNLALSNNLETRRVYTLSFNAVDFHDNRLEINNYQFGLPEALEMGDLVINEIMFVNPDDADEYVEIYNLSDKLIDISGLRITTQTTGNMTSGYAIPAGTVIFPKAYLGLVRRPNVVRSFYGLSDDIPLVAMPFPTTSFLNNTSATVFLTNNDRNVIYDQVPYNSMWHDTEADTKGVSLERINPEVLARDPQNWQSAAENVNFGTPGYENSRYQNIENIMPRVFAIDIISANRIRVTFSKPIYKADFQVEGMDIAPTQTDNFTFSLALSQDLETKRVYFLNINAVDFYDNWLERNEYKFGFPEAPEEGDLIFNELMFDSTANSEDYIEIYNKSDKIIDLTGVSFMRVTASTTPTVDIPAGTIIFPRDYLAFSARPEQLREQFNTPEEANIVSLNLGTFLPNNNATIFLINSSTTFDELTYSDRWHSPLISSRRAVSLERINPNLPTQDASNWHSAASNVNWGTPGYKNSQFRDDVPTVTGRRVWAEPENFTPDNDGHNDVTNIFFSTDDVGFFATVFIYDALGRKIRTLANNTLISPEAFIRWDGTDDNGQIVNVGIYAVYAEIIRTDGKREQFKFPCVVSAVKR